MQKNERKGVVELGLFWWWGKDELQDSFGERGALSCLTKCERIYKIGGGSPEAAARGGEQRGTCAPPWD